MVLDKIKQPNDIKKLNSMELESLPEEIRDFLIEKISVTGGHLASNLGVVELTMALHLSLNLPKDKIIWDVGHQAYTHKILTGRKDGFDLLRQSGGMSGFPKRNESDCDCFDTGHSSTSLSAGLGMACARELSGDDYTVVSVIGDGALTGGMAFEALNNVSQLKSNYIMILNDNEMSISANVGGLSRYLSGLRAGVGYNQLKEDVASVLGSIPVVGERIVRRISKTKNSIKQLVIPGMLFENMGITYLGPIDGHNVSELCKVLNEAKKMNRAVLVHVRTKKGYGYMPAERYPSRFHGVGPFEVATGQPLEKKNAATYTDIMARMIVNLAVKNEKIVGITAAMPDGTGLKRFSTMFPERFFDVGIAEAHAVTFAAGLAQQGYHPIVAIYSSFLQRAYDQILHDVCLQRLPVIFAIDRAGLVGNDGETHQGLFDLSYLSMCPGLTIFAPKNKYEMMDALDFAADFNGPFAIRYPRAKAYKGLREFHAPIELGKAEVLIRGNKIALLAVGTMVQTAMEVQGMLAAKGYQVTVVNVRFVMPWDVELLDQLTNDHDLFVTMEENVLEGGFGQKVGTYLDSHYQGKAVLPIGVEALLDQGNVDELKRQTGLDAESIAARILTDLTCR